MFQILHSSKVLSRLVTLLAASVLLAACSSGDKIEVIPPSKLVKYDEEMKFKKLWSKSVGAGQGEYFNQLRIAVDESVVYAADYQGYVTAIDRYKGSRLWSVKLKTHLTGGVGADQGLVVVGTVKGEVIALNQEDGSEQWRAQVSSEVLSAPQITRQLVVVQSNDGGVHGLNVVSGEEEWSFSPNIPVLTLRGTATPAVADEFTIAGFANGKITLITNADGIPRWEQRVGVPKGTTELERLIDVDTTPLVLGDRVYAVGYQGDLIAVSLHGGEVIWHKKASSLSNLAEGFDNVYLTTVDDSVLAFDQRNGADVWSQSNMERRQVSAPQSFGDYVVVGDFDGYLHAMSQVDGRFVGRYRVAWSAVSTQPIVVDEVLYVLSDNGKVTALEIR